jgi:hypothetical protein
MSGRTFIIVGESVAGAELDGVHHHLRMLAERDALRERLQAGGRVPIDAGALGNPRTPLEALLGELAAGS